MRNSSIVICFLLLLSVSVNAVEVLDTITYNGIRYVISAVDVPSCKVVHKEGGYTGNLVIPEKISVDGKDFSVVTVASGAFAFCPDLKSVSLPNSLRLIGDGAFSYCDGLRFLEIPEGVTAIGEYAFANSFRLNTLILPSTLRSIGYEAFSNYSLARIFVKSPYIPSYSEHVKRYNPSVGGYRGTYYIGNFTEVSSTIYVTEDMASDYPTKSDWYSATIVPTSYPFHIDMEWQVPDSLLYERRTNPYWNWEYGDINIDGVDYKLTSDSTCMVMPSKRYYFGNISIPEVIMYNGKEHRVTEISQYAFYNCIFLESVSLPGSIHGNINFSACRSLKTVSIPHSIGDIDLSIFSECLNLKEIIRDDDIIEYDYDRDTHLYYYGNGYQTKRFPGLNNIPSGDSYDVCSENVYYKIIDGKAVVTSTDNLSRITIPESISVNGTSYPVTEIKSSAFGTDLLYLSLPASVSAIAGDFRNCFALEQVNLDIESPLQADLMATLLENNTALAGEDNVAYTGNVAIRITDNSFSGTISVKEGTRSIAKGFGKNASASVIELPAGIEYIGPDAFAGNPRIESINIPESVNTMYLSAVAECPSLKSVTIPAGCSVPDALEKRGSSQPQIKISDGIIWNEHFVQTLEDRIYYDGQFELDGMITDQLYSNANAYTCSFGNGVKTVPSYFSEGRRMDKMANILLGENITSIGNAAFQAAPGLEELHIDGVPEIGSYAFAGSPILQNVYLNSAIPPSIVSMESELQSRLVFQAEDILSYTSSVEDGGKVVTVPSASGGQALLLRGYMGSYSWKSKFTIPYDFPGTYAFYAVILPDGDALGSGGSKPNKFYSPIDYLDDKGQSQEYVEKNSRGRIVEKENKTQKADTILLGKVTLYENYMFGARQEVEIGLNLTISYSQLSEYSTDMVLDCIIMDMVDSPSTDEVKTKRIESVFAQSAYDNATLHVPSGSIDAYRNAPCWKLFKNIVEDGQTSVNNVPGIQSESQYYDIMGRPALAPMGRGLYIKDGKKVYVAE